jgi:sigma-B regulation protein RsbU (phosphoserine phosphatase)
MLDQRSLEQTPLAETATRRKVLLVDDDAVSRRLLSAALTAAGLEVTSATSGKAALRAIEIRRPDIVLLDFDMPGLNGDEVCARIRAAEDPAVREMPVIMLTAFSGEAEEIGCLRAGASDFVTKPVSRAVLEARIETQLRLHALRAELLAQNEELARWRAAQEADLAAARATQQAFIPASPPVLPGWAIETRYEPVIQVGGDVFGWRPLSGERWLFWLADATGHGAAAALFTALTALLFDQASDTESEPAAILRRVNRDFFGVFNGRSFLTACCAVLGRDGTFNTSGAGHPPILIRRANGTIEAHGPHGTMLGVTADLTLTHSATRLEPGDSALLYSDGLFAWKDTRGQHFTPDTLARTWSTTRGGDGVITPLLKNLRTHSDGEPLKDDLAVIAVSRAREN